MKKSRFTMGGIRSYLLLGLILGLFCSPLRISAQNQWEGNATMGGYGTLPFKGLYGASNSFPRNTVVEVENLETGGKTQVIIVDRLDDDSLLLALSQEAGIALSMVAGSVIRVRAVPAGSTLSDPSRFADEEVYNLDPNANPLAEDLGNGRSAADIEGILAQSRYPADPEESVSEAPTVSELPENFPPNPVDIPGDVSETEEPRLLPVEPSLPLDKNFPRDVSEMEDPRLLSVAPSLAENFPGDVPETEEPRLLPVDPPPPLLGRDVADSFPVLEAPEDLPPSTPAPFEEEPLPGAITFWHPSDFEEETSSFPENFPPDPVDLPEDATETEASRLLAVDPPPPLPGKDDSEVLSVLDVPEEPPSLEVSPEDEPHLLETDSMDIAAISVGESPDDDGDPSVETAVPEVPPTLGVPEIPETPSVMDGYEFSEEDPEAAALAETSLPPPEEPPMMGDPEEGELPATEDGYVPSKDPVYDTEEVELVLAPSEMRPPPESEGIAETSAEEERSGEAAPPQGEGPESPITEEQPDMANGGIPEKPPSPGQSEIAVGVDRSVPMVERLELGSHYIQLGVFGDKGHAVAAVSLVEPDYPALIWYPSTSGELFKVLVGPLMPDESGTLLYLFKADGYGDAFLRKM